MACITHGSSPPLTHLVNKVCSCGYVRNLSSTSCNRISALFAVCRSRTISMVFIVAHAPSETSPVEDKDSFWDSFWTVTLSLNSKFPVFHFVVLGDMNARVGSVPSRSIGQEQSDKENNNGSLWRRFLEHFGLVAVNTFFPAGRTWTSGNLTTARLDYVGLDVRSLANVTHCHVADDIDLTLNEWDDHAAVTVGVHLSVDIATGPRVARPAAVNKLTLCDRARVEAFQQKMWSFRALACCCLDMHLRSLAAYTLKWAIRIFGSRRDTPRQPWISQETWALVRLMAPGRRMRYQVVMAARRAKTFMFFAAWASTCHASFTPGVGQPASSSAIPGLGWKAVDSVRVVGGTWASLLRLAARATMYVKALRRAYEPLIARDRQTFLQMKAFEAQKAAHFNDARTCFAIVRSLAGNRCRPVSSLYKRDGTLTCGQEEYDARLVEHNAELFKAAIVDSSAVAAVASSCPAPSSVLHVSPEKTEAAYRALKRNKGVGPDGIPCELLQAGGRPLATKYCEVEQRCLPDLW